MQITRLCREFHCLPTFGGVMDQPHGAIIRIEAILEANAEYEDFLDRKRGAKDNVRNRHSEDE